MSNVWLCIPSALPGPECQKAIDRWRERGYRAAIFRDADADPVRADLVIHDEYRGWPKASNVLCGLAVHAGAKWCVCGGDDIHPHKEIAAEWIELECLRHYGELNQMDFYSRGVMQPTGDNWMKDEHGVPASARICGSPWIGAEFILGMDGKPFYEGYHHFFADEELHEFAKAKGLLWQRPDLTHYHDHWSRKGIARPAYLDKAQAAWQADKELFERRKAAGFPL